MNLRQLLGTELLFLDGAMGTMMQEAGLAAGENPEYWLIEKREVIKNIHKAYLDAGCNIMTTCTFGANPIKQQDGKYTTKELVEAAIEIAREAIREYETENKKAKRNFGKTFVALDTGSTGKLLEPLGELSFEGAVAAYKEMFTAGQNADAIIIETMTDTYEIKAAVVAAKESTDLPIFVTAMLDEQGKLLTGGDARALVAMLEGLGVDALGLNCGFGPEQMLPHVEEIIRTAGLPVIVTPNAGLPRSENGETIFDLNPSGFAGEMKKIAKCGPWILGGCCGTTPAHMEKMIAELGEYVPAPVTKKNETLISSYTHAVKIGKPTTIIGEKINPTGNKKLAQAIRENDMGKIVQLGVEEKNAGAEVLDVNMGLPDIDEIEMLPNAIKNLQAVVDLPLVIDCSDTAAIEKAVRIYNGKPLINSVNAKQSSMDAVFPIVQKYGGAVIGLTLGEEGIPKTAQGRVELAKKIINEAAKYGIDKKDIVIDALAMTISADNTSAKTTLKALEMIREDLGVNTVLGVSNISFGLPAREKANTAFFAMAIDRGLSGAIINPFSDAMMETCIAARALTSQDENCSQYITAFEGVTTKAEEYRGSVVKGKHRGESAKEDRAEGSEQTNAELLLKDAIIDGLKDVAVSATKSMLKKLDPMEVVNDHIIPALGTVGEQFETGESFLPQLLMSAEAAGLAFEEIKKTLPAEGREKKGKIILATVEGDIHDIGKNIVKVLLENYDYEVIDLGKDVPCESVVKAALENKVELVGLSALMTTTVVNMEKTISLLKEAIPTCKICVGGAVLTEEYAKTIGADYYCSDAMATVRCAENFYK